MNERVFNFSAGPSQMPVPVLEKIRDELLNYEGSGCSVLEMSHRTKDYENIIFEARDTLKEIMNVPDDYEVLFMQGGASTQFSMVPMNMAKKGEKFGYIESGVFAKKAYAEGKKWGEAIVLSSTKDKNFKELPVLDDFSEDLKFIHMTGNNTIYGTMYTEIPDTKSVPLIADWSSAILGVDIDVNKYDLIYAGAQKNMGPSGLAVVIGKKDIFNKEVDQIVPSMLTYKLALDNDSMYNTPPTFSIYVLGLMVKWVKEMGGVKALEEINRDKAKLLYDFIDNSKLYVNDVKKSDRSIMNVTFNIPNEERVPELIKLAKENGIINVKGHRAVGGLRASIYNGMPILGVKKLIEVLKEFEMKY